MTSALLAAGLAHAADAGWHVEGVGATGQSYYDNIAVAGNDEGRRVVAWVNQRRVYVALARPGRGFGAPRLVKLNEHEASFPRVVMNREGDALVLWSYFDGKYRAGEFDREEDCCFGVRLAVLRHDGRLTRVQTLTPRGHDVYVGGYTIDGNGGIGVVWSENEYYFAGRHGLFGRFSGPRGLRAEQKIDRSSIPLAVAFVHGRPRVLMSKWDRKGAGLFERWAERDWSFGHRRRVARGLDRGADIAAATNERGDEVVAWWRDGYGRRPIRVGTRGPGDRLRIKTVDHAGREDSLSSFPAVAIAPSGAAAVAWVKATKALRLVTTSGPGQRLRGPLTVATGGGLYSYYDLELGINARQESVLAWIEEDSGYRATVTAAVVPPGGPSRRRVRLGTATDRIGLAPQGTAVMDGRGRATVVWRRYRAVNTASVVVPR
jgi:hypothetical protein